MHRPQCFEEKAEADSNRSPSALTSVLPPPFCPSLISLTVSVDVKHHVYLLTYCFPLFTHLPTSNVCYDSFKALYIHPHSALFHIMFDVYISLIPCVYPCVPQSLSEIAEDRDRHRLDESAADPAELHPVKGSYPFSVNPVQQTDD